MVSFNQCVFIGNNGKDDPEIRMTEESGKVARFRLAVETDFRKDSKAPAMWLTVVAWRKLADQVEAVVKKGSLVLVSGRLSVRPFTDKEGGKHTIVEVIAQSIQVLPTRPKPAAEEEAPAEELQPAEAV